MSEQLPISDQQLRQGFKYFNRFMLTMWRLGLGPWINFWPEGTGRIMVLAQKGRKSGHIHHTPVNYSLVDGDIYCTAGFGAIADWYRNLIADPNVEVWLPQGWWTGVAEDVTGCPEHLKIMRQVLIASGFAARVAGIDAINDSDERLAAASTSYRLIRIRRQQERTGPDGPGDLAWVWPLATMLLLPLALRRRRNRR
jgi:deazaflavin-dependent oxidoreductase (nitroreductase family)